MALVGAAASRVVRDKTNGDRPSCAARWGPRSILDGRQGQTGEHYEFASALEQNENGCEVTENGELPTVIHAN